jgi:hypothetical protein
MIKSVATAACALSLASAAPACAQSLQSTQTTVSMPTIQPIQTTTGTGLRMLPGMNGGQVNRTIAGTPGLPGTVINPLSDMVQQRRAASAPLYHNGLAALSTPSVDAANRRNGVAGQQGVAAVREVGGIRPVDSPPLNQRNGASRPVLSWQP